jgi:AraC-like DNA-binding protein
MMLIQHLGKNHPEIILEDEFEIKQAFAQYFELHNLRVKSKNQPSITAHQHIPFTEMSVTFSHWKDDIHFDANLEDAYLIWLPVAGVSILQGVNYSFEKSEAAVLQAGSRLRAEVNSGSSSWIIKMDRQALERELSVLIKRPLTRPIVFQSEMDLDTERSQSWWRSVEFLLVEMTHERSVLSNDTSLSYIEHLLINSFLLTQPHNYSQDIDFFKGSGYPVYMNDAETFIIEHAKEELTLDDIVKSSHTSYRVLFNGFKEFHQLSPMNYLRKVRMEGVREELIKADPGLHVAPIAMRWAFNHLGRFSVEYKKRFGESPSKTLVREV